MKVWVETFSNLRKKSHPFLVSSDIFCSCPRGMMMIEDDEGSSSSEGSSLNDSYVEALLENALVSD